MSDNPPPPPGVVLDPRGVIAVDEVGPPGRADRERQQRIEPRRLQRGVDALARERPIFVEGLELFGP